MGRRRARPARKPRSLEILWGAKGERGKRPRLGVGGIVEAAIRIAARDGLAAVSMQRVASDLGYTTMSLYRHVPGKSQLVDIMADAAAGLPPMPTAGPSDWRAEVERWVDSLWDVYQRHPWLLSAPTRTAPTGPNQLAWFDALLRALSQAGLTHEEMIAQAMFLASAVRDLARVAGEVSPIAYPEVLEKIVDGDRFPMLAELIRARSFEDDGDVRPALDLGVRRLLDGIEAAARPKGGRRKE